MTDVVLMKKRKSNMKLFPIYQMIGLDFIFYYAIQVLFLTQVKGISSANIVLASSIYALASVIVQVPISLFVDKVGKRNALVIGNILNVFCMIMIIICPNFICYIIEECINAIAFGIKSVTEGSLLNSSIPECKNKSDIFTKIHSKGYSKYYYVSAISTFISGMLYDINPYIPVMLCVTFCVLGTIISTRFFEIDDIKSNNENIKYVQDLKSAFSFILKSSRLRSLLIILGFIWGILILFGTYKITLLNDLNISATYIGIISAILSIITGRMSTLSNKVNEKYKNKTLTIIGLMVTMSFLLAGAISIMEIPFGLKISIIIILYIIEATSSGIHGVIQNRYISNFAKPNILTKLYSANSILSNILRMLVGFIGTIVLNNFNIKYAMIITGILFTMVIYFLYRYSKNKLGLKPEEYKKSDIVYEK